MKQPKAPNPSRNHHTIPQFYLKGFASRNKSAFVWVYRRGKIYLSGSDPRRHNPYEAPIKKASVIRDFYSYKTRQGEEDHESIEAELQKRESEDAKLLQKLRAGNKLDEEEKDRFSRFIMLMHLRTPTRQAAFPELWAKTYEGDEQLFQDVRNTLESTRGKPLEPQKVEELRAIIDYEENLPDEIRLASIFNEMPRCVEILSTMQWRIFVAPVSRFFATNDNPVAFTNGLGKPDAEVWFPLSSSMILATTHAFAPSIEFHHIDAATVDRINQAVCQSAKSEVYASREDANLVKLFSANHSLIKTS